MCLRHRYDRAGQAFRQGKGGAIPNVRRCTHLMAQGELSAITGHHSNSLAEVTRWAQDSSCAPLAGRNMERRKGPVRFASGSYLHPLLNTIALFLTSLIVSEIKKAHSSYPHARGGFGLYIGWNTADSKGESNTPGLNLLDVESSHGYCQRKNACEYSLAFRKILIILNSYISISHSVLREYRNIEI